MSTVANFWSIQMTKFQAGLAALVIAAAAVLTPAAIAEAQPDILPTIPASPLTDMLGTDPISGPFTFASNIPWWWFQQDPTNPIPSALLTGSANLPGNVVFEFQPLALVPGFLQPLAGWFLNLIPQASICFAGLGASFGPYGRITVKTGAC